MSEPKPMKVETIKQVLTLRCSNAERTFTGGVACSKKEPCDMCLSEAEQIRSLLLRCRLREML